jgi:hypothetical protein
LNKSWGGVFGLADAQTDGSVRSRGGGAGKELFESLKRVGLEGAQEGVHPQIICDALKLAEISFCTLLSIGFSLDLILCQ